MYYLTDICLLCLKNNIKLQSVLTEDNDGIVFIEKIRICYSEIIDSFPDTHKLACLKCLEKLRFLYDFKQCGTRNNTVVSNYLGKLQCENKTLQQPEVIFAARKRRRKLPSPPNFPEIKLKNVGNSCKLTIQNRSCQPAANENVPFLSNCPIEERNVQIKNEEKVDPVTETETINIEEEVQFSVDDYSTNNLDEEDSEETLSNIEDIEIDIEEISTPNDYNNQKETTIFNSSKSNDTLQESVTNKKFCNSCQELLFKDLNNINLHLNMHMQSSNCFRCRESIEAICTFQRHILIHCSFVPRILNTNEYWKKCALCAEQFDNVDNLKLHINFKHTDTLSCQICFRAYMIKVNLVRHILMIHCRVKIIRCKICSKQFTCKETYEEHMIYEHFGSQICICKYCKQTFTILNELREHILRSHDNARQAEEKIRRHDRLEKGDGITENINDAVTEPEKNFTNGKSRSSDEDDSTDETSEDDNHETKNDSSGIKMAEEESNSRTSNSVDLNQQIGTPGIVNATAISEASYCEPDPTFNVSDVCDICQKMFLYLINLSEHLNTHMHEFSCSMCKDSAEKISRLQRHMLIPCRITNIVKTPNTRINDKVTCVVCQEEFYFYILRKHMYNHITDLNCVLCGKLLCDRSGLHRHLMHHCNLKPFQCEVCGKTYTTKESLKYHVNSKHSSKVALCHYCQKRLQCPKTLSEHIKAMHPELTYRCEVCKKNFVYKNQLEKHAKLHN